MKIMCKEHAKGRPPKNKLKTFYNKHYKSLLSPTHKTHYYYHNKLNNQ